mgnify:CR=1 FL=1
MSQSRPGPPAPATGGRTTPLPSDYPPWVSTWPRTPAIIHREIGQLPPEDSRKITWENASVLYDFPVANAVQDDPNAY